VHAKHCQTQITYVVWPHKKDRKCKQTLQYEKMYCLRQTSSITVCFAAYNQSLNTKMKHQVYGKQLKKTMAVSVYIFLNGTNNRVEQQP
jgi:hypothetical protein